MYSRERRFGTSQKSMQFSLIYIIGNNLYQLLMLCSSRTYGCENQASVRLGVIVNATAANTSSKVRTYKVIAWKSELSDLAGGLCADRRIVLQLVCIGLK
jgi:hypothetical protein